MNQKVLDGTRELTQHLDLTVNPIPRLARRPTYTWCRLRTFYHFGVRRCKTSSPSIQGCWCCGWVALGWMSNRDAFSVITWQYTNTVGADARIGLAMEHVSCSYPEAETDMDDQEHRRERPPTRRCSTEGGEVCYTYTYEAVQRVWGYGLETLATSEVSRKAPPHGSCWERAWFKGLPNFLRRVRMHLTWAQDLLACTYLA